MWYILCILFGFMVGLLFYSKLLDKPETMQKIGKQKAKRNSKFLNFLKGKLTKPTKHIGPT